jgi:pimeloyl-ACP methyl ester carboxylesterase
MILAERIPGLSWSGKAAIGAAAAGWGAACLVYARARQAERENPPVGRMLRIDGVTLHHLDRGEGEPVILLHGNGSMLQDFVLSGAFDLLSRSYRVIAFDRPGYGYSTRPGRFRWTPKAQAGLFLRACRALGVSRPRIVAHSWGTLVALEAALAAPDDVGGLVLISGYYYPTARGDAPLFAPPSVPLIGDVLRYTVSPLLGRAMAPGMIKKLFAPQGVPERFRREFPLQLALRPSQIRASAEESAMMIPAAAALRCRYAKLRVPAVVLAGACDRVVDPERQSTRLSRDIAAQLRLTPSAGHMVHHQAPEAVRRAVEECVR